MKIAVVGATGVVGSKILERLDQSILPISEIIPVASHSSVGKDIVFRDTVYKVCSVAEAINKRPALALFSAGAELSLSKAQDFSNLGTLVIDNSSAWRMEEDKCLIVPEVNGHVLKPTDKIVANPNCSTIQLVMALKPLHDAFGLKRVVVATYQAVSGSGQKGISQLMAERQGLKPAERAYAVDIDLNLIPHIDVFLDNLYTKEEMKVVNETKKILQYDELKITATAVRVPVLQGHSEAVNVEFCAPVTVEKVRKVLSEFEGVKVSDQPSAGLYPMPKYLDATNDVFVGRIRLDESQENAINMWVVADNLLKGAAGNAVQIAEYAYKQGYLGSF